MATFQGTAGNDTITGSVVSPGVVRNPVGSIPSGQPDLLDGGTGDDSMDGGGGNDTLVSSGSADTLLGSGGDDVFRLSGVFGGATAAQINGGAGTDTIVQTGALTLTNAFVSSVERLELSGTLGAVTLRIAQLDTFGTITAAAGATTGSLVISTPTDPALTAIVDVTGLSLLNVTGNAGRDAIVFNTPGTGPFTNISMDAGDGDDLVTTGAGNDALVGGSGNDTLTGGAGNDSLDGGTGTADSLSGGAGNDTIVVGFGTIFADGGADDDLLLVSGAPALAQIIGGTGTDSIVQSGTLDLTNVTVTGVEQLTLGGTVTLRASQLDGLDTIVAATPSGVGTIVMGTPTALGLTAAAAVSGFSKLTVTGNSDRDSLTLVTTGPGTASNIQVDAGGGADSISTGDGNDTLNGGTDSDTLFGGGGNDILDGGLGTGEVLTGGSGNDTITVGPGTALADGGDDDDSFLASGGAITGQILGGAGTDTIVQSGALTLTDASITGVERLALSAGLGTVTLRASQLDTFGTLVAASGATAGAIALGTPTAPGLTADVAVSGLSSLAVTGNDGRDALLFVTANTALTVNAGAGDDAITAGGGNDSLFGEGGADTLAGNDGDDSLDGGTGPGDSLSGGNGNDTLAVGAGTLLADGGIGNDVFRIGDSAVTGQVIGGDGTDVIVQTGAANLTNASVSGIEQLALDSTLGPVTLRASQLDNLTTITAAAGATGGAIALGTATGRNSVADVEVAGLGLLTVTGFAGRDALTFLTTGVGTFTNIAVNAGAGDDLINGGAGDDTLRGEGGTDTLSGGIGNDSLDGGAGTGDVLSGGAGNDSLALGGNVASANGSDGDDSFFATGNIGTATSIASIFGGIGTDRIVQTGALNLTNAAITGVETLALSGVGSATLRASQFDNFATISAAAGATTGAIVLSTPTDLAFVADVEVSGLSSLTVTGNAGRDTLAFLSAATSITVNAGNGDDLITSGDGNDVLLGQAGNDSLLGGAGNDSLDGGAGVGELLAGGDGNDTIVLGANVTEAEGSIGNDVFLASGVIGTLAAPATITGGDGQDTIVQTGTLDLTNTFTSGVETLALSGALFAVTLRASLFDTLTTITAAAGATTGALILSTPTDPAFVADVGVSELAALSVTGTSGRDALTFLTAGAGPFTDVTVTAGGGADSITGGGGDDVLLGQGGNDTLLGDAGNDSLDGGAGTGESLSGGIGDDSIAVGTNIGLADAGDGNDSFFAAGTIGTASRPAQIIGGAGTDTLVQTGVLDLKGASVSGIETLALSSALGAVTLNGAQFDMLTNITAANGDTTGTLMITSATPLNTVAEVVVSDLATLFVTASGGRDVLIFTAPLAGQPAAVNVNAGSGNDAIAGGAGADTLDGGSANDSLAGRGGADSLNGGDGNDSLNGGIGNDTLFGGAGFDRFRFASPLEGVDTILDFSGGDQIEIERSGFGASLFSSPSGFPLVPGRFVSGTTDQATSGAGTGQFVFNTTTSTLSWDADGLGGVGSVAFAVFAPGTSLSASDILVFP